MTLVRQSAMRNFERARRRAWREELSARLTGREAHLLPFEAIRTRLRNKNPMYNGIGLVPLEQIVGSVGRYAEFTRQFLPLHDNFRERWVRIETLAATEGWQPIEVYQVGGAFFVKDGNHRVAVGRQMGIDTIEAHIWTFPEAVEVDADDHLDDVLIRIGEQRFLEETKLDKVYPDYMICFTAPGRYEELLAQIEELREKLASIDGEPMSYTEAAAAWYDMIYLPTVQIIHEAALIEKFPGRTEADLFVWLSVHRRRLDEHYGGHESLMELASTLARHYGEGGLKRLWRQVGRLLGQESAAPLEVPAGTEP